MYIRHKAQKPTGIGRYVIGQKRCQICEIFIKWDGLWCPRCGYRLCTKPRNLRYKERLREKTRRIGDVGAGESAPKYPPMLTRK
jgi:DNA-directed RNA polymerase subunit RPC12/RpoP